MKVVLTMRSSVLHYLIPIAFWLSGYMGFIPRRCAANPIPPRKVAVFDTPLLCGGELHFKSYPLRNKITE